MVIANLHDTSLSAPHFLSYETISRIKFISNYYGHYIVTYLSVPSSVLFVCDFVCKHFKLCPFFTNQHLRYVATGHKGPNQYGGCRATFVLFCCASPAILITQTQVTNTRSISCFHFAASQHFLKQVTMCS